MSSKTPNPCPICSMKPPGSPSPPPKPPRPGVVEYVPGRSFAPEPPTSTEVRLVRRALMDIKEGVVRSNDLLSRILYTLEILAHGR